MPNSKRVRTRNAAGKSGKLFPAPFVICTTWQNSWDCQILTGGISTICYPRTPIWVFFYMSVRFNAWTIDYKRGENAPNRLFCSPKQRFHGKERCPLEGNVIWDDNYWKNSLIRAKSRNPDINQPWLLAGLHRLHFMQGSSQYHDTPRNLQSLASTFRRKETRCFDLRNLDWGPPSVQLGLAGNVKPSRLKLRSLCDLHSDLLSGILYAGLASCVRSVLGNIDGS